MPKDRNGKEIEVGDEIVLLMRVKEIVPGGVGFIRAIGINGKDVQPELLLYPDETIVQRKAKDIKLKGCPVRGCGLPNPHTHDGNHK